MLMFVTMDPPPDLTDLIWLFEAEPRWSHARSEQDRVYEEQQWP